MSRRSPVLLLTILVVGMASARIELVHMRTMTSRTFDNGDRTYTAEIVARLDDSAEVRPDSSAATGMVTWEHFQGGEHFYWKDTPTLYYCGLEGRDYSWRTYGFARFGLASLPPGLVVVSALLRYYQWWAVDPSTSVDHIDVDPIQTGAQGIWEAPGVQVSPWLSHDSVGWVARWFNQSGLDALRADVGKGWSAYRINVPGLQYYHGGGARGAGHESEPRIEVTYRLTGIELGDDKRERGLTAPSVCQGTLMLPDRQSAELLDPTGRRVMSLQPGINDIRHVAPGVYFIAPSPLPSPPEGERMKERGVRSAESGGLPAVRKVVVQR